MNNLKTFILMASVALFMAGCESKPDTPGERLDNAVEETGDAIEDAGDNVKDSIDDAAD